MILLTMGALVVAWDLWLAFDTKPGNTVSEIIQQAGKRPIIPFGFGILMGHFFW